MKFPSTGTVFDYCIDAETKKFVPWSDSVPGFEFDPDMPLQVRKIHCVRLFAAVMFLAEHLLLVID